MWILMLALSVSVPGGIDLQYAPTPYRHSRVVGAFSELQRCASVGWDLVRNLSASSTHVSFMCSPEIARPEEGE